MIEIWMPPGFFWELPPIKLPLRAMGGTVVDASGMVVANCPCGSYADAVAFTINDSAGVHRPSVSPCFPYGTPEPGQRNADDMGYPPASAIPSSQGGDTK